MTSIDTSGNGAVPAAANPSAAVTAARDVVRALLDEVERAVVGKRAELELIVAGLLADGHVLLDDLPGVAKTLTARSIATAAGMDFRRIQFTPDVLPSDITGTTILDLATNQPRFVAGPIFSQLVLADEINRAPAKTQAALLEAMQERQVTADGVTRRLPAPFLVIATQNPIESEGTFPLPEAQLDRFILRTRMGYPTEADELEMLRRRLERRTDEVQLRAVTTVEQFIAAQQALEYVQIDRSIGAYVVAIVRATRSQRDLEVGSSPRGSLALLKLARAHAMIAGRDFTTPDDVRAVAVPALAHRVVLTGESWARRVDQATVVTAAVNSIPAPTYQRA